MKWTLWLSGFLVLSAYTAAASEPATFDRTLSVSGRVLLDIRSDPGGINIKTGVGSSVVRVHAIVRPLYGRFDLGLSEANIRSLTQKPPIEQTGNRIRIGFADPELLKGVSIHLDIEVPRDTQARAQTTSGGIKIDGIAGPAEAESASGHTEISNVAGEVIVRNHSGAIVLRNIGDHVVARNDSGGVQIASARGPVELQTDSGRMQVSDVSGELRSTTHSGSISIDNVEGKVTATNASGSIDVFQVAGPVHAESKSGAIRISQISPAPIRALTNSGSIKVDLAARRGYLIDAQSDSGKVSGPRTTGLTELADVDGLKRHRLQGQVGAGGPLVDLDTHSSSIEID